MADDSLLPAASAEQPAAKPVKETKAQRSERLKLAKNPWEAWEEVREYARQGREHVAAEWTGLYFKWWGIYTQGDGLGATGGVGGEGKATEFFMMRIGLPNGILSSHQLRVIADITRTHARNLADITTRQNIQLHWLTIGALVEITDKLTEIGLSPKGACGDVVRNVTGCPLAGLDHTELLDASPLAVEIAHHLTANPAFYNLPRKFKISVTGCPLWCSYPEINDVALTAIKRTVNGSKRSATPSASAAASPPSPTWPCASPPSSRSRRPSKSSPPSPKSSANNPSSAKTAPAPASNTSSCATAGPPNPCSKPSSQSSATSSTPAPSQGSDPARTRLQPIPPVQPRRHPRRHLPRPHRRHPSEAARPLRRRRLRPPRPPLRRPAAAARRPRRQARRRPAPRHHHAEHRPRQHPQRERPPLIADLKAIDLEVEVSPFWRGAIACTGTEFCKLAIAETKGFARWLVEEMEGRLPGFDQQIKLHVTGCTNSCGQHWIADIGLEGKKLKATASSPTPSTSASAEP